MATLDLTAEDLEDLLNLLKNALTNVNAQINNSSPNSVTRTLNEIHRRSINEWIQRLSQLEDEETRYRHDSEQ